MLDEKTFDNFRNDLYNAVADAFYKYSDGNGSDPDEKDFDKAMAWVKRGFFDTYDDGEITSGCHDKTKKDKKEPVESSVDTPDEDFEDEDAYMKDLDERLRAQYADENGLNLNEDMIDEDDYNEWVHRGAAMYSSVDRNRMNVKALYSSPKKSIKSGREPYFYQLKDEPSTNTRLGEMNCTYNLPSEEINNLYGSWFEIYDDEDLSNPLYKDAKPLSELTEDDKIFVPGDEMYSLVSPSKYDYKGDVKFFG